MVTLGLGPVAPARAAIAAVRAQPAGQVDWSKFHADDGITGATTESLLGASGAASLGVNWMANLQAFSYSSPVAVWSSSLGKLLVIAVTGSGFMTAYDGGSGQAVWSTALGTVTYSTPLVSNGVLYIGMRGGAGMRAYDVATGRLICNYPIGAILSSPTIQPATGDLYITTLSHGNVSGAVAVLSPVTTTSTHCATVSTYNKWGSPAGSALAGLWSPTAAGVDAKNRPLAIVGTDDPDGSVYAVDTATNQLIWRYKIGSGDVGAGAVVSPPGVNGIADGAVYVMGETHRLYALDLTTGVPLWTYAFTGHVPAGVKGGRSTVALSGDRVYAAYAGVFAFNATSGALLWSTISNGLQMPEVVSSPAVTGAAGNQAVIVGDTGGTVHALNATTGQQVWSYQTGAYIFASPAVSNGIVYLTSTDGYLYAFGPGGGNSANPTTTISTPSDQSELTYPSGGALIVKGSASDDQAVSSVLLAIQRDGARGPWWNASTHAWSSDPSQDTATLATPGAATTTWSYSFPVPVSGGDFTFFAEAVDNQHQGDLHEAHAAAYVGPAPGQPTLTVTPATSAPAAQVTLTASGFSANETIASTFMTAKLANLKANASGGLAGVSLTIPGGALPGTGALTLVGMSSGLATSAPLTISTPWPQFRFDAAHTGYEPNENVFSNQDANYLFEVWSHQAGAAVESSPAVVDGVVYVGDDGGNLSALDRRTGSVIWAHATGSAVTSSPAVDGSTVIVGTAAGTVIAVDRGSGAPVWSFSTGGPVRSSASFSGTTAYIGSDDGNLYALNASTGAKLWSAHTGAAIASSPAISGASVIVGSEDDDVYAFDSSTGSLVWKFATGGKVDSSPTVSGGDVYAGSADHAVYALNASTGKQVWRFATGGPVSASPAVDLGMVVIGSDDHDVYALTATSGGVVWKFATKGTVRSSAATASNMAVFGSSDGDVYALNIVGGHPLFQFTTGNQVTSSPTVSDGVVYAASWNGDVYEFTPYGTVPA